MNFNQFQRMREGVPCLAEVASSPEFKGVAGYTYDGLFISRRSKGHKYSLFLYRDEWTHNNLETLERILWAGFWLKECNEGVHYDKPLSLVDVRTYVTGCFDASELGSGPDYQAVIDRFDASLVPLGASAQDIDGYIFKGEPWGDHLTTEGDKNHDE